MTAGKRPTRGAQGSVKGFTAEEREAMREYARERRAGPHASKADGERALLEKIAAMPPSDRVMAERIHALVKAHAPTLVPRTWYGMPAYSKGDQVLCFFQSGQKFKTRYATLGFSDEANLDEGHMWPTVFALTELNSAEEARIVALLKKAIG